MNEELIVNNVNLVHHVCKRFRNTSHEYEDLYGAGMIGLVEAAKRYNPGKGAFSTFAVPCITGRVMRHLRDYESINFPRPARQLYNELRKIGMLDKSLEEIAKVTGKSIKTIKMALDYATYKVGCVSLHDAATAENHGYTYSSI